MSEGGNLETFFLTIWEGGPFYLGGRGREKKKIFCSLGRDYFLGGRFPPKPIQNQQDFGPKNLWLKGRGNNSFSKGGHKIFIFDDR